MGEVLAPACTAADNHIKPEKRLVFLTLGFTADGTSPLGNNFECHMSTPSPALVGMPWVPNLHELAALHSCHRYLVHRPS